MHERGWCSARIKEALGVLACASIVALGIGVPSASAGSVIDPTPPNPGAAGMSQLDRLPIFDVRSRALGASSHAKDGSNFDWDGIVRRDRQGRDVLMEATGPGVVNRLWMTGPFTQRNGNPTVFGQIQFFIDGETTPRINLPATAFFGGAMQAFPTPLCGDHLVSSDGDYCHLRIPFAKSVKVVTTGPSAYYNVGYETYPQGTRIRSYKAGDQVGLKALRKAADLWRRSGKDPRILPAGKLHSAKTVVPAEGASRLVRLRGRGTIRTIRIGLDRYDDETLRNVRLEARWDGSKKPAVKAPLADLFLSGAGEREPAKGLFAGYLPDRHEGYLHFPMPFARGAVIRLVNPTANPVIARWSIRESSRRYRSVGHATGRFHATFNHDPATPPDRDYVMLTAKGTGKVVGVSFTAKAELTSGLYVFLEGDERVYFDGSRTPAIYGTGAEDFFGGAYYYTSLFTLPDHGANAKESADLGRRQVSQYRLMLSDPWMFRKGIRLGMEHSAGNGQQVDARSVVYWYGSPRPRLRQSDTVNVPSKRFRGAGSGVALTSFFEGDRDGNVVESPDGLVGALPPPPGTDPHGESVTAAGMLHPVGTKISFTVKLNRNNRGMVLRRMFDQGVFGQRASVKVNGRPAGIWFNPGDNQVKRWAESDFTVPARLTRGRKRAKVELRVLAPVEPPTGASVGWSDFRYTVFSSTP